LGVFLILTLWLTQKTLMQELFPEDGSSNRPNAILFDIQPDQQAAVADTIRAEKLPVLASAPVVTMRIQSVKGRNVETILAEHGERTPNWVLRREYRSTYRDALVESEKLAGGEWIPRVTADTSPIPISLETGIAKDLGVVIGDEIVFDVQGVPMTTRVASLREVDWRRVQANFFVVFPLGVLEEAPGFYIISTRTNNADESARLQRAVVKQFPNVSTIDLTLVLQTLDGILTKISFAIRFMAGFTVLTGLLVLVGAVLTGRYQRLRESILLRTLGASRKQILQILTVEYLMMGVFAGATGILLAIGANWALAVFMFKVAFALPPLLPLVVTLGAVSALTIVTGLMTSWGISNHPPLEILRAEG
jgi:putative ABC transport system permease protein